MTCCGWRLHLILPAKLEGWAAELRALNLSPQELQWYAPSWLKIWAECILV